MRGGGGVGHRIAELRRDDNAVAAGTESAPEELLALALPVRVGGVEERVPLVERGLHDQLTAFVGRVLAERAEAEAVAPEPDRGDTRPAIEERGGPHSSTQAGPGRAAPGIPCRLPPQGGGHVQS